MKGSYLANRIYLPLQQWMGFNVGTLIPLGGSELMMGSQAER